MKDKNMVLVCVTAQASSEKLVKAGEIISKKLGGKLEVVSVLPISKENRPFDPSVIEALHSLARKGGGDMALYFSDDPVITLCAHIGKRKPATIVVGFPGENSNNFVSFIHLLLPDIPISMVNGDSVIYNILPQEAAAHSGNKI